MFDLWLLGQKGGDFAAVSLEPSFTARFMLLICGERRVDTEDGVGFFIRQPLVWPNVEQPQFIFDLLGQAANLVVEGLSFQMQIMIFDQIAQMRNLEGN